MMTKQKVEKTVRDIRRHTRKKYSAEEKIRIVLEGLRFLVISVAAQSPFHSGAGSNGNKSNGRSRRDSASAC